MFFRIGTCGAACSRLLVAAICTVAVLSRAEIACSQPSLRGQYESYSAVGLHDWPDPYSARGRLRVIGSFSGDNYLAYVSTRFSKAIVDPERGGADGPLRTRLLEAFVDLYAGPFDVRVGHQLVVWGQMDGVFVTDVVSPLDLTEFLAQDFTDIRLAVPAVKVAYFAGPLSATGLLIVAPVRSLVPGESSPWFAAPDVPGVSTVSLDADDLPDPSIKQIEPGLKLTYGTTQATVDLIYFYGKNRIPAFSKEVRVATSGFDVIVSPTYERRHVLGARVASTVLDPFVIESEWSYESGILADADPSSILDQMVASSIDGLLIEVGHLTGGVSAARTLKTTLLRLQTLASILTRGNDTTVRDRFVGAATMLWQSSWSRETYTASIFCYYGTDGDYWLNPALRYNVGDGLNLSIGGHFFGGEQSSGAFSTSAFGLFDKNDFVYTRLTLAF